MTTTMTAALNILSNNIRTTSAGVVNLDKVGSDLPHANTLEALEEHGYICRQWERVGKAWRLAKIIITQWGA